VNYSKGQRAQSGAVVVRRLNSGDDNTFTAENIIVDMNQISDQGVQLGTGTVGNIDGTIEKLAVVNGPSDTIGGNFQQSVYFQNIDGLTIDEVYIKDNVDAWALNFAPGASQTLQNVEIAKAKIVNCWSGVLFWRGPAVAVTLNNIENIAFDTVGPGNDGSLVTQAGSATGNTIGTYSQVNTDGTPHFFTNTSALGQTEGAPTLPQDLIDLVEGVGEDQGPFPSTSYDRQIAELRAELDALKGGQAVLTTSANRASAKLEAIEAVSLGYRPSFSKVGKAIKSL
jgi:hypothetical protein